MAPDTNGKVAPAHLATYQGVQVSVAILPDLRAAGDEFRRRGYTFGIYLPDGGYRSWATQVDMHVHPGAHNLLPSPPAPPLAPVGFSRHGFGRSVDVFTDAPWLVVVEIMGAHHFTHWNSHDAPHWEWGNVLQAADVSSIPLGNTPTDNAHKEHVMYVKGSAAQVYVIFTDANGTERLRYANLVEGQLATAQGSLVVCSDTQLTELGAECGWVGGKPLPLPLPKVDVDLSGATVPAPDLTPVLKAIAAGEAQDAAALQQLLGAIGQVDEATLATFGLKRA